MGKFIKIKPNFIPIKPKIITTVSIIILILNLVIWVSIISNIVYAADALLAESKLPFYPTDIQYHTKSQYDVFKDFIPQYGVSFNLNGLGLGFQGYYQSTTSPYYFSPEMNFLGRYYQSTTWPYY